MVAGVATDELEFRWLNMWPISRRHGDVGTETHNILHTIKMGRLWPVMAIMRQLSLGDLTENPIPESDTGLQGSFRGMGSFFDIC